MDLPKTEVHLESGTPDCTMLSLTKKIMGDEYAAYDSYSSLSSLSSSLSGSFASISSIDTVSSWASHDSFICLAIQILLEELNLNNTEVASSGVPSIFPGELLVSSVAPQDGTLLAVCSEALDKLPISDEVLVTENTILLREESSTSLSTATGGRKKAGGTGCFQGLWRALRGGRGKEKEPAH